VSQEPWPEGLTAPLLTTTRFELWQPRVGDLAAHMALLADPEVTRYLAPTPPDPEKHMERLIRHAESWLQHGYGLFAVRPHGSEAMIASCGLFHSNRGFGKGFDDATEAGWIVARDWWGQGVAREVMEASLAWFEERHGPRRMVCMIEEGNLASERLAAALGFVAYGRKEPDAEDPVALNLYERQPKVGLS